MYTIKDLAEGRCAVKNDGTREEIKEVMNKAFPNDLHIFGTSKYYFKKIVGNEEWDETSDASTLLIPIQSVKDFLQPQFERGEEVKVRDKEGDIWIKRLYLTTVPELTFPHICVEGGYEERYKAGNCGAVTCWRYIDKIEKEEEKIVELTLEDISEKTGIPVHLIRIKD